MQLTMYYVLATLYYGKDMKLSVIAVAQAEEKDINWNKNSKHFTIPFF